MAGRRRRTAPPYDVMGGRTGSLLARVSASESGLASANPARADAEPAAPSAGAQDDTLVSSGSTSGSAGAPAVDTDGDTLDMDAPRGRGSADRFGHRRRVTPPIVLRLPPGYALMVVGLLVGLIVLAFWVGKYVGYDGGFRRGYDKHRAEMDSAQARRARYQPAGVAPAVGAVDNTNVDNPSASGTGDGVLAATGGDRRKVGLNYWIVSRLPQPEADDACRFLKDNGVDSFVHPLDNSSLCHVIALLGFTGENEAAMQFKGELERLGRIWKTEHKGTDAFRTMFLSKYKGP